MPTSQTEEQEPQRKKRVLVDQAIALAMQNRWEEAARTNQDILKLTPNDVDALNRLGRSLNELGRYREAKDAYAQAVKLDPLNSIAQRNLSRLSALKTDAAPAPAGEKLDPRLFTTETGKTGVTVLARSAPRDVLAKMAVGDQVSLVIDGRVLQVANSRREVLGRVEPRLAQRLISLMTGGNRYVAALISLDDGVRVLIREIYQHPKMVGRVSFPTRGDTAGVRAYIRGSLVRSGVDDDDDDETYNEDSEAGVDVEAGADEAEEHIEPADLDDDHVGS